MARDRAHTEGTARFVDDGVSKTIPWAPVAPTTAIIFFCVMNRHPFMQFCCVDSDARLVPHPYPFQYRKVVAVRSVHRQEIFLRLGPYMMQTWRRLRTSFHSFCAPTYIARD